MDNGFFALISRMKNISRWSLMRNTFPDNVQEHSHTVAVLAHALAVIRRDVYSGDIDPNAVAVAALYHDAPEILTGDLPTPVKYHNPDIMNAYKQVEHAASEKLISLLPEEMKAAFRDALMPQDEEIIRLVKGADKLSAYIKCTEELRAGNNEFRLAANQTHTALVEMKLPEVDYFLLNFMPAFEVTLDEITL